MPNPAVVRWLLAYRFRRSLFSAPVAAFSPHLPLYFCNTPTVTLVTPPLLHL